MTVGPSCLDFVHQLRKAGLYRLCGSSRSENVASGVRHIAGVSGLNQRAPETAEWRDSHNVSARYSRKNRRRLAI
jgi:hypothetical protein